MTEERPTLTIMPDYAGAFCWIIQGDAETTAGVGGCCGLPWVQKGMRQHPNPLEKEFESWQAQFDRVDPGQFDGFDWRLFHVEGISLTRRLKALLGDKIKVVYEKPFEDPDHDEDERREVMVDGDLVLLPNRRQVNNAAKALRDRSGNT